MGSQRAVLETPEWKALWCYGAGRECQPYLIQAVDATGYVLCCRCCRDDDDDDNDDDEGMRRKGGEAKREKVDVEDGTVTGCLGNYRYLVFGGREGGDGQSNFGGFCLANARAKLTKEDTC